MQVKAVALLINKRRKKGREGMLVDIQSFNNKE